MQHLTEDELERYYLGMVLAEAELAQIEEHLLWCADCLRRAEDSDAYVDAIRGAAVMQI